MLSFIRGTSPNITKWKMASGLLCRPPHRTTLRKCPTVSTSMKIVSLKGILHLPTYICRLTAGDATSASAEHTQSCQSSQMFLCTPASWLAVFHFASCHMLMLMCFEDQAFLFWNNTLAQYFAGTAWTLKRQLSSLR